MSPYAALFRLESSLVQQRGKAVNSTQSMNVENARKLRNFPSFRASFQVADHSKINVLSQRREACLKALKLSLRKRFLVWIVRAKNRFTGEQFVSLGADSCQCQTAAQHYKLLSPQSSFAESENSVSPFKKIAALSIVVGVFAMLAVHAQPPRRGGGEASLAQPFVGITSGGKVEPGLFKIESTGVSTKPVIDAANALLDKLSDEQVSRTMYPVDHIEWRSWDNRHFYKRRGVGFDEMNEEQRTLAFGLLKASLSAKGLKQSKDIMKLNGTLAELANNFDEYGEWLYWITIMGDPSSTKPWGWQIDGHHLIINYFVLGDQVVMSPVFVGSEPVHATSGRFKGTIVMQDEQDKGLALIQSLSKDQQKVAIISSVKDGNNALTQAYKDNVDLDYAGIPASTLDAKQQALLLDVVQEFVGTMNDGHAAVKMEEVKRHLDRTFLAWIGGTSEDSVFYYRIHSPAILIEFDHERRVAPFRSSKPTKDHIHAVMRTPNGNDYGKDLLRQHVEQHHKASAQTKP